MILSARVLLRATPAVTRDGLAPTFHRGIEPETYYTDQYATTQIATPRGYSQNKIYTYIRKMAFIYC
jgi:hypothetical protein